MSVVLLQAVERDFIEIDNVSHIFKAVQLVVELRIAQLFCYVGAITEGIRFVLQDF